MLLFENANQIKNHERRKWVTHRFEVVVSWDLVDKGTPDLWLDLLSADHLNLHC